MNLINLGSWEIVLIVVIAILAVGPKRMVQIVRTVQRWAAQARRLTGQLMSTLQTELDAADELKGTAQEAVQAVQQLKKGLTDTATSADAGSATLASTAQETTAALRGLKEDLDKTAQEVKDAADQKEPEAEL